MMDGIRQWLLGVLAAAMALSLLYALLPKGAVRGAARATGGLILLLVVLGPLRGLELSDLALRYEDLSRDMERQAEAYRPGGPGAAGAWHTAAYCRIYIGKSGAAGTELPPPGGDCLAGRCALSQRRDAGHRGKPGPGGGPDG